MPGDSPGFDLYDGRRDSPSLRQKTLEVTSERVSESESYEMGLQIPRGVYSEAAQEDDFRGAAQTSRRGIPGVPYRPGVGGRGKTTAGPPAAPIDDCSAEIRGG